MIEVLIGTKHKMIIDDEDHNLFLSNKWKIVKADAKLVYVISLKERIRFHRLVMNAQPGEIIDHINGNTLDNRKNNLRKVTHQENIWNGRIRKNNKSGIQGVSYNEKKKKWRAYLNVNDKFYGKEFLNKEEAIKYRKFLEQKYIKIELLNQF
jgi:hypothetical protein